MHIIVFLLIGLVAGWLAGVITSSRQLGLLGDMVVGVVGAFLGAYLLRVLGVATWGLLGQILTATLGAVVLLVLIRLIKRA